MGRKIKFGVGLIFLAGAIFFFGAWVGDNRLWNNPLFMWISCLLVGMAVMKHLEETQNPK